MKKISLLLTLFVIILAVVFRVEIRNFFMFNNREYIPKLPYAGMVMMMKMYDVFFDISRRVDHFKIEPGMCVCDYGCGPGRYLRRASELVGSNGEVYAVDIHDYAKYYVERVIEENGLKNVKFIMPSKYDIYIENNKFDRIYSMGVFHHISQPTKFLKMINRICKPDGYFIIERFGHQSQEEAIKKIKESKVWEIINEDKRKDEFIFMKPIKEE